MKKFFSVFFLILLLFFSSCNEKNSKSLSQPVFNSVNAQWNEEQKVIVVTWKTSPYAGEKIVIERKAGKEKFVKLQELSRSVQSFTDSNIFDGISYVYRLTGFNSKGVAESITTSPVVPPDSFPPETFIDITPSEPSARAFFTFTGVDRTSGYVDDFECKIDDSNWEPCSPPYENRNLSIGSHTFYVRAIDPSGNKDDTPATYSWEITATYWKMIDSGNYYSCGINIKNELYCWGYNEYGQLGIGSNSNKSYPVKVGGLWKYVSAGNSHTCAIKEDGTLWCWGNNSYGALGIGLDNYYSYRWPQKVGSDSNWIKVSSGYRDTCGLKSDGTLWCWGYNYYGQLGLGTDHTTSNDYYVEPNQVGSDTDWVDVITGFYHTCAIKDSGDFYCWGRNNSGQLGVGNNTDYNTPQFVGNNWAEAVAGTYHTCGIKTDGTLYCWGYNYRGQLGSGNYSSYNSPHQVGSDNGWRMINSYKNSVCALNGNKLYCWGNNDLRYLGFEEATYRVNVPTLVTEDSEITYISVGSDITCKISGGHLFCWGNIADYGQLGIGDNGSVYKPMQTFSGNSIKKIIGNRYDTSNCLIDNNDKLFCSGSNNFGQLGIGSYDQVYYNTFQQVENVGTDKWIKFSVGHSHVCGIQDDNSLWCWGNNSFGDLGIGVSFGSYPDPQHVGSDEWISISSGWIYTCGIKIDGTLWCWGYNGYGQLGLGDYNYRNVPVQVGSENDWVDVVAGFTHTCGLRADGSLWCWGDNGYGQLGLGNHTSANVPQQVGDDYDWVDVVAGFNHTCGLKTDHSLWCWGHNYYGQVGVNSINYVVSTPLQVSGDYRWKSVSAGYRHTCGVDMNNNMRCWGSNEYGSLALTSDLRYRFPVKINSDDHWKDVTAGRFFTCGVNLDNKVYCWGNSKGGSLGLEDLPWTFEPQKVEPLWY